MSFRFRKSVRIAKGLRVNFSKRGASLSVGRRGASVNLSSRGTRTTVGLPGTGLSWSKQHRPAKRGQGGGKAAGLGFAVLAVVFFAIALLVFSGS